MSFPSSDVIFTVPMRPTGKGRPRVTTGGTFTPQRTKKAQEFIIICAKQAQVPLFKGPVMLQVSCYFKFPKGWSKKKKNQALETGDCFHTGRPDLDNIAKLVADALNGIAYKDDAQIVKLWCVKRYGVADCMIVRIGKVKA